MAQYKSKSLKSQKKKKKEASYIVCSQSVFNPSLVAILIIYVIEFGFSYIVV